MYKQEKQKKNAGKYNTLVNISIITPLADRLALRFFMYITISATNAIKQSMLSIMLTGYRIGYFGLAPNAAIRHHTRKHIKPNAPTAESPNEIAEVSMAQYFFTVLLNTRQKQDDTASPMPRKPRIAGNP